MMQLYGTVVNAHKCNLAAKRLELFGHLINSQGIRPLDTKVQPIRLFPSHITRRNLGKSFGPVRFLRIILPDCTDLLHSLKELLETPEKPAIQLLWTDTASAAFTFVEDAFSDTILFVRLLLDASTQAMVPAANMALASVLQQHNKGESPFMAFFPRKLQPCETRHSVFGMEQLAVYAAVRRLQCFVEGSVFDVSKENKPIT